MARTLRKWLQDGEAHGWTLHRPGLLMHDASPQLALAWLAETAAGDLDTLVEETRLDDLYAVYGVIAHVVEAHGLRYVLFEPTAERLAYEQAKEAH